VDFGFFFCAAAMGVGALLSSPDTASDLCGRRTGALALLARDTFFALEGEDSLGGVLGLGATARGRVLAMGISFGDQRLHQRAGVPTHNAAAWFEMRLVIHPAARS
jgi:hypothetical protein